MPIPKFSAEEATKMFGSDKHEFADRRNGARCKHCLWEPKPTDNQRRCTMTREMASAR